MARNPATDFYQKRAAQFRARAEWLRGRAQITSNVRLGLFLLVVGVLVVLESRPAAFLAAAVIGAILFMVAVRFHRRVRADLRDAEARLHLSELGLARIARDWDALPPVLKRAAPGRHPYADDLDLFGAPAVSQLFGPVRTLHGVRLLRRWLEHAAPVAAIHERQDAIRVLAEHVDFRETLAVSAAQIPGASQRRVQAFLHWVTGPRTRIPGAMVAAARLLPLTTVAIIVLAAGGVIPAVWAYAPLLASVLVTTVAVPRAYRAFDAAFTAEPAPLNYAATFAAAERAPDGAPLLQSIQHDLRAGGGSAARSIRRLEQIMHSSDARRSGIFAMILEVLFMWSLNALIALEHWRAQHAEHAASWFEALGKLEALSSLATLAHDQPQWSFPHVDPAADRIDARAIAHPMLNDSVRVVNDVQVGPKGALLLITGSNMSGKSTLLRAVGVNTVLAHAGAPVCAQSFRTPPVRLYTSINVRDSLAMGASLYMAQLARLKDIIEAARSAPIDEPCCYLLDEILSGTNSADRTTAVRAIVHELLQLNAIGALTTHDLALAADARIAAHAVPIHFAESIDPSTASMTFDYRVRSGVVQSSNALALMKLMGFRLDD